MITSTNEWARAARTMVGRGASSTSISTQSIEVLLRVARRYIVEDLADRGRSTLGVVCLRMMADRELRARGIALSLTRLRYFVGTCARLNAFGNVVLRQGIGFTYRLASVPSSRLSVHAAMESMAAGRMGELALAVGHGSRPVLEQHLDLPSIDHARHHAVTEFRVVDQLPGAEGQGDAVGLER